MNTVDQSIEVIWWRTLITHRPVENPTGGRVCPVCQVRRCWPRAEAFGQLVAHDKYLQGPPPDIARPQQATG